MTVAPQGELTLRVNKLAWWQRAVAVVSGLGTTVHELSYGGDCGLRLDPRARLNCAAARWAYPSRAVISRGLDCRCDTAYVMEVEREMRVHTIERPRPSVLSPSLWPS